MMSNRIWFLILFLIVKLLLYSQVDITDINITPNLYTKENSVFIHPDNPLIILNSNNIVCSNNYGVQAWGSFDGGLSWSMLYPGCNLLGNSEGDPSVKIDKSGNFYVSYVTNNPPSGQGIGVSANSGINWMQSTVYNMIIGCGGGGVIADKEYLWIDNKKYLSNNSINPYFNKLYIGFTDLGGVNCNEEVVTISTNNGQAWSLPQTISHNTHINSGFDHGVNIKTGIDGEVYSCWAIHPCNNYNIACNERYIGFSKSNNGGATWSYPTLISIKGSRFVSLNNKDISHNSYPSMAVNQQNGYIYITWTENDLTNNDFNIFFTVSQDQGSTWSSPIQINQNSSKDQWQPWIACDPISNAVVVIYYDCRNSINNDYIDTYVNISYDNGNTWSEYKINDIAWSIGSSAIMSLDYIGVDIIGGHVVPVWTQTDNSNVITHSYTNPFDTPCPQNMNLTYGHYYITDEVTFSYDASYSAINTLQAAGQSINGSTYKIYPGASVYMSAGDEVVLEDGFESEGELIVENNSCTNISSRVLGHDKAKGTSITGSNLKLTSSNTRTITQLIYPNPTNGSITIQLNDPDAVMEKIQVMNTLGECVINANAQSNNTTINLSSLQEDVYTIKVFTTNQLYTQKVVLLK